LYLPDGKQITITNYNLSRQVHENGFIAAGFSGVAWSEIEISPEGKEEFSEDYWKDIVLSQPVTCISANK
jgi:hypothetical protein